MALRISSCVCSSLLNLNVKTIYTQSCKQAINIKSHFKYGLSRRNESENKTGEKFKFKNAENDSKQSGIISRDLLECTGELKKRVRTTKTEENYRDFNNKLTFDPKFDLKGEIIFGIHPILLALRAKRRNFNTLFVKKRRNFDTDSNWRLKEIKTLAQDLNLPIKETSGRILDQLTGHRLHQSVCLDCGYLKTQFYETDESEMNSKQYPVWLLLHRVKDPMNLGAIIRTAYFMGVDKILSTQTDSCPLTPVVSKASSGSMEIAPYFYVKDLIECLKLKRESGWEIVGTVINDEENSSLCEFVLSKPTILIIGNEGEGLDENVLELCTKNVSITPGYQNEEKVLALNVSVATGIILHSILRKNKLYSCNSS